MKPFANHPHAGPSGAARHRVAAVVLALGVVVCAAGTASALTYVAQLTELQGEVFVVRNEVPYTAFRGFRLADGDTVKTTSGTAKLLFDDDKKSEIRLQRNTEMEVNQPEGRFMRSLKVSTGRLWARIFRRRNLETEFQSGTVVTAIRGTVIEYSYDKETGTLIVGVITGSLTVSFQYGGKTQTITVNAGQMIELKIGSRPALKSFKKGSIYGIIIDDILDDDIDAHDIKALKELLKELRESSNRGGGQSSPYHGHP